MLALSGCVVAPPLPPVPSELPVVTAPATPMPSTSPLYVPVHPVGDPIALAHSLKAPWSIVQLPSGGTLISERDTTVVREMLADKTVRQAGIVAAADPAGEGGLLGLAFLADASDAAGGTGWVYAFLTSSTDNRIERMPLLGSAGSYGLGPPEVVLTGIPKAAHHNGGRIAFGPDGLLYATTGDAGILSNAQNKASLGGKILRMTATGGVPSGNPFDTLVYSYGHRNPQGIAWDAAGQLWASEFGQNKWDELNRIVAGGNYGWPTVEGKSDDSDFINPFAEWPTDVASPSGIAIVGETLFLASLKGERLRSVDLSTGTTTDWFVHGFGRLRDVVTGPTGTLWFVTNNTDGRGQPRPGDDRLLQVQVAP
nr:PQQ-dependent sugar dehydrogenase [Leifsonia psychrotolerans]